MPRNVATTDDLFAVCADRYGYSEPVARVLSNVIYWSQFARNYFHGHLGIYKTDAEVAKEVRKHPKTVGRLLREVCAPAESASRDAVFLTRYGPKPAAHSGRVRWLFRTELGDQIIAAAEVRAKERLGRKARKQNAVAGGPEMLRSASSKRGDRSPQNAPTHMNQKYLSESHSNGLSSVPKQREKIDSGKQEGFPEGMEEVERFVRIQNKAAHDVNRPDLAWQLSEVNHHRVGKFIQQMGLAKVSDEYLLTRLRLLASDLEWLDGQISPAFMRHNREGLGIKGLVYYGPKVWRAVEEKVAPPDPMGGFKMVSPLGYYKPKGENA